MHKSGFRDALSLRYDWPLLKYPSYFNYGHVFGIDHVLSCPTGGFPSIRHNELRDVKSSLLSEVRQSVTIEPHLQPISKESISHIVLLTEDSVRLDITAYGFREAGLKEH